MRFKTSLLGRSVVGGPAASVVTYLRLVDEDRGVPITTMSAREFNQDVSKAKKAANEGPVFVTDRGRPSHVLLTIDEYHRITGTQMSIVELLAMPGIEHIELDVPRLGGPVAKAIDLS